ncbi:MAG: hypothetical protein ACRD3Z_02800 [Nitrososphaerales archaeon]
MSKYRSFPLIARKKRVSKAKRAAKQPDNHTGADPRATTGASTHAFGLGYPSVFINYDFHLLR